MLEYQHGDIFHADAEALVNTVNCVGVMGRGIALQFRKAFPENFAAYAAACKKGELAPGAMFVFNLNRLENPRYVINFPTKRHWKGKSHMRDIELGLGALIEEVRRRKIRSIAVPPLGCGLGGLDWNKVRLLIEKAFVALPDVAVLVYEPSGAPAAESMVKTKKAPAMTVGRAALLGLMRSYLAAVMDPFVSLLEIHKLMYLLQESGEQLKLNYVKGTYGPYAENLRHVLSHIEGHFITGFGDAEDNPEREIELNAAAAQRAVEFLKDHTETLARFDRVVNLIEGFETPYGMELLATVHWVGVHEGATGVESAIEQVYIWNERNRIFPKEHIRMAWHFLARQGWLAPTVLESPL